jgi:hypothetical protein
MMSPATKYVRDATNVIRYLCLCPWVDGRIDLAFAYCLLVPIAALPARQGPYRLSDYDRHFVEAIIGPIWLAIGFGFALGAIRFAHRIFLILSIPIALFWGAWIGLSAFSAWQTIRRLSNLHN